MIMIHPDKCEELGLPLPKSYDTQPTYVLKAIAKGYEINTRIARYIGIHNLHSVVSKLSKDRHDFTIDKRCVTCPFTNQKPPFPVDVIYMNDAQKLAFNDGKVA